MSFCCAARDEPTDDSDLDVLVSFAGTADSKQYFYLSFYLEDLLGCPHDLVADKAIRTDLRTYLEKYAIDVA